MSVTIAKLIDNHGGPSNVARAINYSPGAISLWKHRNRIPRRAWPDLMASFPAITLDALRRLEAQAESGGGGELHDAASVELPGVNAVSREEVAAGSGTKVVNERGHETCHVCGRAVAGDAVPAEDGDLAFAARDAAQALGVDPIVSTSAIVGEACSDREGAGRAYALDGDAGGAGAPCPARRGPGQADEDGSGGRQVECGHNRTLVTCVRRSVSGKVEPVFPGEET